VRAGTYCSPLSKSMFTYTKKTYYHAYIPFYGIVAVAVPSGSRLDRCVSTSVASALYAQHLVGRVFFWQGLQSLHVMSDVGTVCLTCRSSSPPEGSRADHQSGWQRAPCGCSPCGW
jgi:hypothetical protein